MTSLCQINQILSTIFLVYLCIGRAEKKIRINPSENKAKNPKTFLYKQLYKVIWIEKWCNQICTMDGSSTGIMKVQKTGQKTTHQIHVFKQLWNFDVWQNCISEVL